MTLDASLIVTPSLLHRQPHRRSGGTVFRQHPGGVGHCSPAHLQQRGRFPSSKRIVQICAISLWRTSGSRRRRELVGFGSMTASFSSRARQWKRPSPARGAALRKFFCGWQGRRAAPPPVRPSTQPFSPPPRSTATERTSDPCGPTGCRQVLHQCQTQGDAYEANAIRNSAARPDGGRAWAGNAPAPVSGVRVPDFHTTAQTPGRPNNGPPEHPPNT